MVVVYNSWMDNENIHEMSLNEKCSKMNMTHSH